MIRCATVWRQTRFVVRNRSPLLSTTINAVPRDEGPSASHCGGGVTYGVPLVLDRRDDDDGGPHHLRCDDDDHHHHHHRHNATESDDAEGVLGPGLVIPNHAVARYFERYIRPTLVASGSITAAIIPLQVIGRWRSHQIPVEEEEEEEVRQVHQMKLSDVFKEVMTYDSRIHWWSPEGRGRDEEEERFRCIEVRCDDCGRNRVRGKQDDISGMQIMEDVCRCNNKNRQQQQHVHGFGVPLVREGPPDMTCMRCAAEQLCLEYLDPLDGRGRTYTSLEQVWLTPSKAPLNRRIALYTLLSAFPSIFLVTIDDMFGYIIYSIKTTKSSGPSERRQPLGMSQYVWNSRGGDEGTMMMMGQRRSGGGLGGGGGGGGANEWYSPMAATNSNSNNIHEQDPLWIDDDGGGHTTTTQGSSRFDSSSRLLIRRWLARCRRAETMLKQRRAPTPVC